MHLYNLTLQPATTVSQAVVGSFGGTRQQEIILARGTRLEILKADTTTGKLSTLLSHEVFATIRSIAAFRLTGGTKGKHIGYIEEGQLANLIIQTT